MRRPERRKPGAIEPMLDRTSKAKKEVIIYYLLNVKSLLRPPVTNYTNKKKITVKLGGLWGVKKCENSQQYISST